MASTLQLLNASNQSNILPIDVDDTDDQTADINNIAQAPVAATPAAPATPVAPTSYTPEQLTIDPASTVEGRIGSIIDKGGVLQQSAKTLAAQQVQQKGLLNTSMAVGAAQKAVIDSAMPIAAEDARSSFAAQQANQAATNRALESESLFGQQTAIQEQKALIDKKLLTASADEQMRLIAQRGELDTQLQNLRGQQTIEQIGVRGDIDKELQALDEETRSRLQKEQSEQSESLENLRGSYDTLLATQQSATVLYANHMQAINEILSNPDIPQESKNSLVQYQIDTLEASLDIIQSMGAVNFSGLIEPNTNTTTGDIYDRYTKPKGSESVTTQPEYAPTPDLLPGFKPPESDKPWER